jgi:hypothetical protein
MNKSSLSSLKLRVDEIVEVRSKAEILATLDSDGKLDGLPFMPEMFKYCGLQFRVYKRADRTCDTITSTGMRRMRDAVHLEGLRCDGFFHGNCQARCLIFWKEAWLNRVPVPAQAEKLKSVFSSPACTEARLLQMTRAMTSDQSSDTEIFSCQATELLRATTFLSHWDFRQYFRDFRSGNITLEQALGAIFWRVFRQMRSLGGYRLQIWLYNALQKFRGGSPYPYVQGQLKKKTPSVCLNIQPGTLVKVRTPQEIAATLNAENFNRGLYFDVEMTNYCGGKFKVLHRVERIINEKTGRMINLPGDCLILDGVICKANYHWACPRSIYPYWREIWLERVDR